MTLMAVFDLIIEISKEMLLKFIKNNLVIGAVPANPPFELDMERAHVIVNDMLLDLRGDNELLLTMLFRNTSITMGPLNLFELDGNFTIYTILRTIILHLQSFQIWFI